MCAFLKNVRISAMSGDETVNSLPSSPHPRRGKFFHLFYNFNKEKSNLTLNYAIIFDIHS